MTRRTLLLSLSSLALTACEAPSPEPSSGPPAAPTERSWALSLTPAQSGTEALLQAVSPVSDEVVWVSGHLATWARSLDGGRTWEAGTMAGDDAEGLQFRDVAAFDASTAYLMSAGTGPASRIYRTDDGGASWRLQYVATDSTAFLDCLDFWTPERGLAYGDAIDGVPFLLATGNGGETWTRVPAEALPAALDGEGGFAASGTCLVTGPEGRAWVAMGNGARARMLRTMDWGASWEVVDVPVVGGPSAGLATMGMLPDGRGIALGGVIGQDSIRSANAAVTSDGGATWSAAPPPAMDGPIYGSALVPGANGVVVAVGPRGLDWSTDLGATWQTSDTRTYWAVAFASPAAGWAVGPRGRVVRLALVGR